MNLVIKTARDRAVHYDKQPKIIISNQDNCDVNIIIPVRGRVAFVNSVLRSIGEMDKGDVSVIITVVEHSVFPQVKKVAKEASVDYIYLKCDDDEPFNKCLCMNMGVFYSGNSKYVLFHDSDLMVSPNFLLNCIENIKNKDTKAIQTFDKRRVLYCTKETTTSVINGDLHGSDLSYGANGIIDKKKYGAPGGSIMLERDLFFIIGGYDPELFYSYSPEDLFFWDKMSLYTNVESCDDPVNEVYHLDHPLQKDNNPDFKHMFMLYNKWKSLPYSIKIDYCEYKSKLIWQYK